ncbi:hypothetical protein EOD41_07465 [Mucilaginibacter limnophilus]|uniref:Uncharacterized protein n=1 Tax=Mucilaginibacter limnophilus TaxID=1932778 RepID=A0A437MVX8_9SPHI|nr:hypothetical protein [Mucilaginibacter limnophilus]RVU01787.1 hypothetical protein EOD41_07465 [Mucilaginibacter limnophilus]
MSIFILMLMWMLPQQKAPIPSLAADIKKDREIIYDGHIDYNRHINFNHFTKYARMNFSAFKFKRYQEGKHNVMRWERKGKNKLVIYQISTAIPVDTLSGLNEIRLDSLQTSPGENLHVKTTFYFTTYIIKPANGKPLIYQTGKTSGLQFYMVGDETISPVYEAIEVGVKYPELNELLKIASK